MTEPKIVMGCKPDRNRRTSPDSAWPIRRADGLTPAQVRPHYQTEHRKLQPMPEPRTGFLARLMGRW